MNTNELRQSENTISIMGYVKEADLQAKSKVANNGEKVDYITGKLVMKVSEDREIVVNCNYVVKLNKNGEVTKRYQTLADFISKKLPTMANLNEWKQIKINQAKQQFMGDEAGLQNALTQIENAQPTCLSIWGSENFAPRLGDNTFYSKEKEEIIEGAPRVEIGFGNLTVKDTFKEEDFHAKGAIEMFVTNVSPEVKGEETTGRAIVKGYSVAYGSKVFPVEVVACFDEEFSFAELCLNELPLNSTVTFYIDLCYGKITTTIQEGGNFGRSTTRTIERNISELRTMGGNIHVEPRAYDEDQMRVAVTHRKSITFDEIKKKALEQTPQAQSTPQGFGGGFGGTTAGGFGGGFGAPTQPTMPSAGRPDPSSLF